MNINDYSNQYNSRSNERPQPHECVTLAECVTCLKELVNEQSDVTSEGMDQALQSVRHRRPFACIAFPILDADCSYCQSQWKIAGNLVLPEQHQMLPDWLYDNEEETYEPNSPGFDGFADGRYDNEEAYELLPFADLQAAQDGLMDLSPLPPKVEIIGLDDVQLPPPVKPPQVPANSGDLVAASIIDAINSAGRAGLKVHTPAAPALSAAIPTISNMEASLSSGVRKIGTLRLVIEQISQWSRRLCVEIHVDNDVLPALIGSYACLRFQNLEPANIAWKSISKNDPQLVCLEKPLTDPIHREIVAYTSLDPNNAEHQTILHVLGCSVEISFSPELSAQSAVVRALHAFFCRAERARLSRLPSGVRATVGRPVYSGPLALSADPMYRGDGRLHRNYPAGKISLRLRCYQPELLAGGRQGSFSK